jgi:hypothetical protein
MSKRLILAVAMTIGAALTGLAQTDVPVYVTLGNSGTTSASGYFHSSPSQQVRVVGVVATSDKAASVLSFSTGVTPATITSSNASGTTITVGVTNGITVNDVLVIESANGITNVTVSSFSNVTNLTVTPATGFATLRGDQVYKMSAATTIKCGATTAVYQGEAIYVGARGRPVRIVIDGTNACSLDSISGRYE